MRENRTGHKGVETRKNGQYQSYLHIYSNNNKRSIKRHIGTFKTPEAAAIARLKFIDSLKY